MKKKENTFMRTRISALLVCLFAILLLSSCVSFGGGSKEKPIPTSTAKELRDAKIIAVLGYNSTRGLDDRLLDSAIKTSLFDFNLEIIDDREIKFPIGDTVNSYEKNLITKLSKGPYSLIDKNKMVGIAAYKAIKGDVTSELNNVNVAKGYVLTYKFDNFMDGTQKGTADKVPANGQVLNNYKDTLTELGADLGIIVVEKPYILVKKYSIIEQIFSKKQDYFGVASQIIYYIVKPATINQVLYSKVITTISDTTYVLKGYTEAQRKIDQATFLDQYNTVSQRNHDEFLTWLKEQVE